MADIIYDFEGGLYFNITNECPCDCVFCVRNNKDEMGTGTHMWHEKAPTFEEIKEAIDSADLSGYSSAVFCGYGEPTCEFDNLIKTISGTRSMNKEYIKASLEEMRTKAEE